jgi:predicted kinase
MVAEGAPVFIVVSGPPGSGKSTLAGTLARELALPLVAKDTIKDALMVVLPVPDVDASRRVGRAAVAAMLAVAAASPIGAVIDCNFHRSTAIDGLSQLSGRMVEVFCRCDRDRAWARYQARAGSRHPGHFDAVRTIDDLWHDDVTHPVAGGWPVVVVETNTPVDTTSVLEDIRAGLR